jgi:hypothetical protein
MPKLGKLIYLWLYCPYLRGALPRAKMSREILGGADPSILRRPGGLI